MNPDKTHLWSETISGDNIMKLIERRPRVCSAVNKAKGGYFEEPKIWNIFRLISHFFVYYIIPYVFIRSSDAFNENLQCK